MKKIFLIFLFSLFLVPAVYGYTLIKPPFKVGEYLEYEVKLFKQTVGIQKVWVKDIVNVNGIKCFHIVADVETTKLISRFYHLHDVFEEFIDVNTLLPVKIRISKKEGKWTNNIMIDIDQNKKELRYRDTRKKKDKIIKFKEKIVGLVSILFYARTYTPKKGEKFTIALSNSEKIEYLTVETKDTAEPLYLKKMKKKISTFAYQQIGGRKIALWISNDKLRLPVRLISVRLTFKGYGITNVEAWLVKYRI